MTSYKDLLPSEVKKMLDQNVQLADIRDYNSFAVGHIPQAQHFDDDILANFIEGADKSVPVILCCHYGISSRQMAEYLGTVANFENVYNLDGGFDAWQKEFPNDIQK